MIDEASRAHSEPRWPASLAILAAMLLYASLPERFTIGPTWGIPALEGALLVGLNLTAPRRHPGEAGILRALAIALTALVTVTNFVALSLLLERLLAGAKAEGTELVFAALQIWSTNVIVFALWFWELDRGGPGERPGGALRPDFLFPQMGTSDLAAPGWKPAFFDYLYVSFTNAMAFSPTDTLPLTQLAKLLMLAESAASLLSVAFVAARAVNILS
jgi:uncharacterized membrane protein